MSAQSSNRNKPISFSLLLKHQRRVLFLSFLCIFTFNTEFSFASTNFPHYPIIKDNVQFWEDIYSTHPTNKAVVHDSNDLSIIYEVIPIFDHRVPGASKINTPIFKGVKQKYASILKKLAKGHVPQNIDEKRVATLFHNKSQQQFTEATESIRIQIGQKDRFIEGVIRSGAYMETIKKIFHTQGLPEELAYLPHVESSFNIKAYSKFGASGIWQFTHSTGKQFLNINYEIDERQDPIVASRAAAQLLKKNYQRLGSWPLALTAYNYGRAGMVRALNKHGSYEEIFSHYDQGHFKFASRNFYSEFLAALTVAKRLEKNPAITKHKPKTVHTFTLPGNIAINDLCNHFNVSLSTIKKLNPALRRPVLQGKKYIPKGYILRLPNNQQQIQLAKKVPSHLYHTKQKATQFYRVRSGDTAGKIALHHKVSLKDLMERNHLDKQASVFVGQNLQIPDNYIKNKRNQQIQTIGAIQKKRSPSAYAPASIAETQQSVPILQDNKKQEAQWKSIQKSRAIVLGELGVSKISGSNTQKQGTITIQPEESLELLADWLEVDSKNIQKLNNFSSNHQLLPDEEIRIPLTNISANVFEEKRFYFHLETEEDFYDAYNIVGVTTYKVAHGDTIWEICKNKFDLPLWLLKKYNTTLNFNNLRSSQQLTIPIIKAI